MKGKIHRRGRRAQSKHLSPSDGSETQLIESSLIGGNSEENDGRNTLPFESTLVLENTVPLENTSVLENTQMLENTVPLEDTVPLETQLLGEEKNKEEKGLLLEESDRDNETENTVDVDNLEGYTEAKTQLLEDFQEDNAIDSSSDKKDLDVVVDSDDGGGGNTELLSEDEDASDGRSSPCRVDELKGNQFPVETFPSPNFLRGKETSQIHSTDIGKRSSFNSIDSRHQHEQQTVVDSDASTEDESDVGEPQKSGDFNLDDSVHAISHDQRSAQGVLPHTSRGAPSTIKLSQEDSKVNKQLENMRVVYQNPDPKSTKDGHKSKQDLSDGLKSPRSFQSVGIGQKLEMGVTPISMTRASIGDSSDLSLTSTSGPRSIASVRVASLRASGMRASRMLSTTKEVTSVKDAKNDAVGKHDSSSMPQSVLVARDKIGHLPGDKPSLKYKPRKATEPNEADDLKETANVYYEGRSDIVQSAQLRAENLTARKLFYTEPMEVDKPKPSDGLDEDDERRYRDNKEEGDEPRALGRNAQDEERAIGGNGESEKLGAQVGDKEDAELSARVKNDKGGIPKEKENSNIANTKKLNPAGQYDLGFNKKSHNCPISSGLNYLDSQEPGEQSQADALNMVDKLVWLNTNGLSQELEPEKLTEMTYHRPPIARGTQNLAHLVECKSPKEKIGVFDWVDSQHDEGGRQFFRKNGLAVLSSRTGEDKVKTESKQISRRSYKGKKDASVPNSKDVKIGKDKSKLLSQGLLKLANSPGLDSNMTIASDVLHGREIKVGTKVQGAKPTLAKGVSKSESAKVSRRSKRLQLGEEQDLHRNLNIVSDKQNARGEKLPLNLGEISEQQMKKSPIYRESSSMSDIDNDAELASEAMQSMPSEIPLNQATEENTHIVEQKGRTKSGESRKRKTRISGVFKKGTLPNTDPENGETIAKQVKASSSLAAQGKNRKVHWAEDEGQVQQKGERRKQGIPRISKQHGKEKVESKGSEINEENQDMLQNFAKFVSRKREGANVEVTSTPAGELQSAGAGTEVGCSTRRMRNMNPGEMHGTKISSGSSEAKNDEEGDIQKGSLNAFKKKRRLETDHLSKSSGEIQPARAALEGMQSKAGTLARHSARQRNQKQMERQNLEAQRDSKSPNMKEEAQDLLKSKNAEKIVGRKRKQADVEDISHKVSNSWSTDQSSKSIVPGEGDSTGADGEGTFPKVGEVAIHLTRQTKNLLDKQTGSKNPAIQDESIDMLWGTAKAVRSKRSQKNKLENYCKPISVGEDLPAGAGEEVMHEKVQDAAVRITRQSMRNLGADVNSAICASTDIERDNSVLKHTVTESRSQKQKSGRRKTTSATPNREKLTDGASLISPSKDEVQVNGTSADVESPCTFQVPAHGIDVNTPASTGHGPETAEDSSKKGPQKKGTPRSTLKRELGRLDAFEADQSSILKDSTRKKREPGSIHVLFSHGLDDDLVKQQRKILTRLGGQATTSPADCTHFVTDKFVRTRNMLEAMAAGKPIVTYLWLENSGQASYFIDEKKYILEDAKKEKEIGFSMSASLASAQQRPLLQNKRLFITPNTKPERDSIVSLVKAANGQVLNSLKGAFSKKDKNMENLIAISCEEDYEVCIPLLEKGVRVYSTEFLLNGIVVQSLDFSRDQLFTDHVKRMRSRQRSS